MSRHVTAKKESLFSRAMPWVFGGLFAAGVIHAGFQMAGLESPFTTMGKYAKTAVMNSGAMDKATEDTVFKKGPDGKRDPAKRAVDNLLRSIPQNRM